MNKLLFDKPLKALMSMETHYEVLNVSENATFEQIKFRFQQLILKVKANEIGFFNKY